MLKSSTSQKPIVLRNCDLGSEVTVAELLTGSRPARESVHPATRSPAETDPWNFRIPPTNRTPAPGRPEGKHRCRQAAWQDPCRTEPQPSACASFPSTERYGAPCAPR